jgi:hypothetical protein
LTQSDVDQIARLLAHATPLVAVFITPPAGDNSLKTLLVSTVAGSGENSQNPDCYGSCSVQRNSRLAAAVETGTSVRCGNFRFS